MHNWEEEWVETAENLICEEWIDQYKDRYICESMPDSANSDKKGTKVREVVVVLIRVRNKVFTDFV